MTGLRFSFSSLASGGGRRPRKMRTNRVNSPERANWKRICFSGCFGLCESMYDERSTMSAAATGASATPPEVSTAPHTALTAQTHSTQTLAVPPTGRSSLLVE